MLAIWIFSQLCFSSLFCPAVFKWSLLVWSLRNDKKKKQKNNNFQKQVWLHRICQVASLSQGSFPQQASGKLSESHLVADANEPLWTHFPICRCLWLSITFKMFKVEQIAHPGTFCWENSAVDEEFPLYSKASLSSWLWEFLTDQAY